jgi:hypothetical protein
VSSAPKTLPRLALFALLAALAAAIPAAAATRLARSEPYAPLFQDFFGLHTGLVERDGRPKPSVATFTQAVRTMSAR